MQNNKTLAEKGIFSVACLRHGHPHSRVKGHVPILVLLEWSHNKIVKYEFQYLLL